MNSKQEKNLILLRGLPGSGKTTLARVLSEGGKYAIYSVDDYFTNAETGEYQFDFSENYLAYKQCEDNTQQSMLRGEEKIILHHTFTIHWELETYFKLAAQHQYTLFVVTVENYHQQSNTHGVTQDQLQKMAEKYQVKLL